MASSNRALASNTGIESAASIFDLLSTARSLLHELSLFEGFLKDQAKERAVDLHTFRASVSSELKSLERVLYH